MIYINEFLPNPAGSDADGEWVELFNGGLAPVNLTGWILTTKDGKKFVLGGKTIGAGEYTLLPRTGTKLTLHNTDGALALYDASGKLADKVFFIGTAPEGKSFSRTGQTSDVKGQFFSWVDPTPGAKNVFPELALVAQNFPIGQPLNPPLGMPQLFGIAFGAAAVLAMLVLIVFKKNENLSKLFFKGNPKIR